MPVIKSDIVIAAIISQPTPQHGQEHRSSGNFGTEVVPGGYDKFFWEVSGVDVPTSVSFDVMQDVRGGTDPVEYERLTDGSVTGVKKIRSLYIANPAGSGHKRFTVTVYASSTGS